MLFYHESDFQKKKVVLFFFKFENCWPQMSPNSLWKWLLISFPGKPWCPWKGMGGFCRRMRNQVQHHFEKLIWWHKQGQVSQLGS